MGGRYLIVLYYNPNKMNKNPNIDHKEELKKTKWALMLISIKYPYRIQYIKFNYY